MKMKRLLRLHYARHLACALALGSGACDSETRTTGPTSRQLDGGADGEATDSYSGFAEGIECSSPTLHVSRAQAWPGGGVQLALTLRDSAGLPLTASAEAASALTIYDSAEAALEPQVRALPTGPGITALVIVPQTDAAAFDEVKLAASTLAGALPPAERIVVWLATAGIQLLAETTADRQHVLDRIAQLEAAEPSPLSDAQLAPLLAKVSQLDKRFGAPQRNLVLIGTQEGSEPSVMAARARQPITLLGLHRASTAGLDAAANVSTWGADVEPADAANLLAAHISQLRQSSLLVGLCHVDSDNLEVQLYRDGDSEGCQVQVPQLPDTAPADCSITAIAADEYPLGHTVELQFTPEERQLHDANNRSKSETDFALHVALGDGPALAASAHFRGQTSLDCARKNYSINLAGKRPHRLFPQAGDDEFHLISMCKETHYFKQVLANHILADLGVFPLEERYVELRIDGESRGPYLLLRKPIELMRAASVALETVIRRRFDPDTQPDVRVPTEPEAQAAARSAYDALSEPADPTSSESLYGRLKRQMDIDGYLRWLAFNTYFHNGDYVDEVFFYASRELSTDQPQLYFRTIAWDEDDLFKNCHHSGSNAHVDPAGLLYCAEGWLDRNVIADAELYAHFVDALATLLEVWPVERVGSELARVREELFEILDDDSVCAAATELRAVAPDAASCQVAQSTITSATEAFLQQLQAEAARLHSKIDAYRGLL